MLQACKASDLLGFKMWKGFESVKLSGRKKDFADGFVGNFPNKVENLNLAPFPAISSSRLAFLGLRP